MSKNVRRGRSGSVRCASCSQVTRRDRAVYLFREGIKMYYCPDCAKKIHGPRLYKGLQKFVRRPMGPKIKRKFVMLSKEENPPADEATLEKQEESHEGTEEQKTTPEEKKEEPAKTD